MRRKIVLTSDTKLFPLRYDDLITILVEDLKEGEDLVSDFPKESKVFLYEKGFLGTSADGKKAFRFLDGAVMVDTPPPLPSCLFTFEDKETVGEGWTVRSVGYVREAFSDRIVLHKCVNRR